ncbi:MAG: DUF2076 domain-containing protein [Rhizobiales bacterium]|nr:DUF2076 domain-containing protein [Hyphomicrobiales bacterium]
MTPDERQMLAGLFDRLREAEANPRDREAEAFIAERAREAPHAAYALAQAVLVQDQALAAADERIRELEDRVREMESRPEPQSESFLGGIGKSLFGSRERDSGPPRAGAPDPWRRAGPAPGYDAPAEGMAPRGGWQGQPGPWAPAQPQQGGRGSSFLTGALGAAAGVAGGMLLANSIQSMFGGQGHGHGQAAGLAGPHGDGAMDNSWSGGSSREPADAYDPGFSRDGTQDAGWDDGGFDGGDGGVDV